MDFTDKDYEALRDKLVEAARVMKADGWWLTAAEHPERDRAIRGGLMREMVQSLVPRPLHEFYAEIMKRKSHDHHASHSDVINQLLHIVSSSVFLGCYVLAFWDLTPAMWAGLGALFLRQIGHAVLEPPCHDKEMTLLGYNTRNKTIILGTYLVIPVIHLLRASALTPDALGPVMNDVAWHWFLRVGYLAWIHGPYLALVWLVKLATDPITDVIAYSPRFLRAA
jgi:glutamate-1-semialdehyde 2,1-aminomutase